jgi:hypothetical protein
MFRATEISVRGYDSMQVAFSDFPSDDITPDNFSIVSNFASEAALEVYSLEITGKVVTLHHSLSSPLVSYTLIMQDTQFRSFVSQSGEPLQVDGSANKFVFIGPESPNDIRDNMLNYLTSVYDGFENNLLHKHVSGLAEQLLSARTAIRQKSNAIYLEEVVVDQLISRGAHNSDRLPDEGAFQVDRVSSRVTGDALASSSFLFSEATTSGFSAFPQFNNPVLSTFPATPYSLQQVISTEIVSNTERINNSFSGLILNLLRQNITQVLSLVLRKGGIDYPYDITTYPVGLLSNRYDTTFAYSNLALLSNQIKLDPVAVQSGHIPEPSQSDEWYVTYAYKDLGRLPDPASVQIYEVKSQVRERVPAVSNVFSLVKFPIVLPDGSPAIIGSVEFLNPLASGASPPFGSVHPAFVDEIPFNRLLPPANPGEFAVDYATGQVLVYGEALGGLGTGSFPPVATYSYKKIYSSGIDYVLDTESSEVVAAVGRGLAGASVYLDLSYEQVYVPGVDYVAETHNEALGEYVENRILGNSRIQTLNAPITDVFRVFNETTGETYNIDRYSRHEISISGSQLPRRNNIYTEGAQFKQIVGEELYISSVARDLGVESIFSISLAAFPVMAASLPQVGTALNTSFAPDADALVREFYFDGDLQALSDNLDKLQVSGDYLLDYSSGTIYFRAPSSSDFFIGTANYICGTIIPLNSQITSVDVIRYSSTPSSDPLRTIDHIGFSSSEITPAYIVPSSERFLGENTGNPVLFGTKQWGRLASWQVNSDILHVADGAFTADVADGSHFIQFEDESQRQILQYIAPTIVRVDIPFSDSDADVAWVLLDADPSDGYTVVTTYEARDVRGVYLLSEINDPLAPLPAATATNYWNRAVDRISGNQLIFNNALAQTIPVGAALVIDYDFGNLFVDYEFVIDRLRIDYEWGDNQIRWLNALPVGTDYYCTYRYGAMRRELLESFAVMLGLPELLNADLDMNRETIRDLTRAAMTVFAGGPTLRSMQQMGQIPTLIKPTINELTFGEWTLGRDNLFPAPPVVVGDAAFGPGRWGSGLDTNSCHISMPAEKIISHRNGSFFCKLRPLWPGINNNASFIVDVDVPANQIWIGASGFHPDSVPFSLSVDQAQNVSGRPYQLGSKLGLFIWYDSDEKRWQTTFCGISGQSASGIIESSGKITYVQDGYVNSYFDTEITNTRTSSGSNIEFSFVVDAEDLAGLELTDGYVDGYGASITESVYTDSLVFVSSSPNYVFDTGTVNSSRISLYRDEWGYLTLDALDSSGRRHWRVSADISQWEPGDVHSVGASWIMNSPEGQDELHLFIDGQEVPNLYRFSSPFVPGSLFRSVAVEQLAAATRPILMVVDGLTTAGSDVVSSSTDFASLGILPGDTLTIMEDTNDGLGSPYTILAVSGGQLTLDSTMTLSLDSVRFSLNSQSYSLTASNEYGFSVSVDGEELIGSAGDEPQYSITRSGGNYVLNVYDGIAIGDIIEVRTLGLSVSRALSIAMVPGEGGTVISYILTEEGDIIMTEDGETLSL